MIAMLIRLSLLLCLAAAVAWLADRPGFVEITWMGYEIQTTLAIIVALAAIGFVVVHVLVRVLGLALKVPRDAVGFFQGRRQKRGFEALTQGFLAIGAGDFGLARRHVDAARRLLPGEPLTKLLDVQAAQVSGDTARVIGLLSEMADDPRTAMLGLRGLHTQAQSKGDSVAAAAIAEQALQASPSLPWAARAVLAARTAAGDWDGVLRLLDSQKRAGVMSAAEFRKKKAVVLTAEAEVLSDRDPKAAFGLLLSALKLDPSLVPAAVHLCSLADRVGQGRKAQKLAQSCFSHSPHAALAEAYSKLRAAASPADRLKRVRQLLSLSHGGEEGAVALARAALAAREFGEARAALADYAGETPPVRVATLLAAIAEAEGNHGLAREWLSRAVTAPRDPQWIADGLVSDKWLPASPVTGELGAFQWKVPVERIGAKSGSVSVMPPVPSAPPAPPSRVEPALAHLPDDPGVPDDEDNLAPENRTIAGNS